jgi:hypothetical protein
VTSAPFCAVARVIQLTVSTSALPGQACPPAWSSCQTLSAIIQYALFTRDAFAPDLIQAATTLKPRLVNLAQIEARLIKAMDRPPITWPEKLEI